MRAAKVQASLRICAVSPEPPLLAHKSSESRGTFRQKARSLAPLNGWACAVKICHDGMLEDTNSLDGAHLIPARLTGIMLNTTHFAGRDLLSYFPLICYGNRNDQNFCFKCFIIIMFSKWLYGSCEEFSKRCGFMGQKLNVVYL